MGALQFELEAARQSNLVNHPPHYKIGGIETIDFIEAKGLSYHLGNVIKYVTRAGHKDKAQYVQDLQKARWYLDRAIQAADPAQARSSNTSHTAGTAGS